MHQTKTKPTQSHISQLFGVHKPVAKALAKFAQGGTNGLLLIGGGIGSGKSTALYSILRDFPSDTKRCVTVEDPVEQKIKGIQQTQVDEANGLSFAQCAGLFVRRFPDLIAVGETRDSETAKEVLGAAGFGLPVVTTVSAVGGVIHTLAGFADMLQQSDDYARRLATFALTLRGVVYLHQAPSNLGDIMVPEAMFFTPDSKEGLFAALDAGILVSDLVPALGITHYSLSDAIAALVKAGEISEEGGQQWLNEAGLA